MKLITLAADIAKAIKSIHVRGAKLDGDLHLAGVSVLAHIAKHRDTTLADSLVKAMPKGSRKLALVEWMLAFGQVATLDPKADKEAIKAGRVFKLDDSKAYDEGAAIAKHWNEFRPEPDVATAFDAQAAVKSVITRLTKAKSAGITIEHKALALAEAHALVLALTEPLAATQD